jgi:hypothetical protein
LAKSVDLQSAFDKALRHVQRSISAGIKTSGGVLGRIVRAASPSS